MTQLTQYYGTGRRKTSIARVFLRAGQGNISVNRRLFTDYFPTETHRMIISQPFQVTNTMGQFDVMVNVAGGGMSGQAGAVRHGISKALTYFEPELRGVLKKGGFLTRDSRIVERKKYGRMKARRSFQFSKR